MTEQIVHRGPDDEGYYIDDTVALGMRRLAIIDLEGGKQPIISPDENFVIVFNGEIYNYRTLRETLIKDGVVFKTHTDTEVILHLYEDKQEKCLDELNGIFAFAIYNKNTNGLFLARDRIGVKPLYRQ